MNDKQYYTPDLWVVIKIKEDLYKVLTSDFGGYLNGDSWRINSGIRMIEEFDDYYLISGYSGSEYKCHKSNYDMHSTTRNVLMKLMEHHPIYLLSEEDFKELKAKH